MPKPCSKWLLGLPSEGQLQAIQKVSAAESWDCQRNRERERELKLRGTCCLFPFVGMLTVLLMNSSSALGQARGEISKINLSYVNMILISKLLGMWGMKIKCKGQKSHSVRDRKMSLTVSFSLPDRTYLPWLVFPNVPVILEASQAPAHLSDKVMRTKTTRFTQSD